METILSEGDAGNGVFWKVVFDNDPTNPRREWDNGSVMVCEHSRYDLGDKDARDSAIEAVRASRDYRPAWEDEDREALDLSEPADLWTAIQRCGDIVAFPLYLYDHSGITIRMSRGGGNPFACRWDSGMVGFVYMTKAMILANWMKAENARLTPALRKQAEDLMAAEVETYDDYLTGQVFGYVVYTKDEDGDEDESLDSCWGFFGQDYCEGEAKSAAEHHAEERGTEAAEALAEEMEAARPDMYA